MKNYKKEQISKKTLNCEKSIKIGQKGIKMG
jgi:hypothetical protein